MSKTQTTQLTGDAQAGSEKPFAWPVRRSLASHPVAFLLALMGLLLGLHPAGAKTTEPILLYCTAYSSDVKSVFLKGEGDGYSEVSLSVANVIELPKAHTEEGKLTLFGTPAENGERIVVTVAETDGIQRPLIVLYPSVKGAPAAYRAITVEADTKAFPLASFQLVNLSPHPIRISHEEAEPFELESEGIRNFAPKDATAAPLAIKIEYKVDDNWLLLSSSSWAARKDRRTLVCIQLDPLTERMNVRSVPLREIPDR